VRSRIEPLTTGCIRKRMCICLYAHPRPPDSEGINFLVSRNPHVEDCCLPIAVVHEVLQVVVNLLVEVYPIPDPWHEMVIGYPLAFNHVASP
jgi:hypothetical protein